MDRINGYFNIKDDKIAEPDMYLWETLSKMLL